KSGLFRIYSDESCYRNYSEIVVVHGNSADGIFSSEIMRISGGDTQTKPRNTEVLIRNVHSNGCRSVFLRNRHSYIGSDFNHVSHIGTLSVYYSCGDDT